MLLEGKISRRLNNFCKHVYKVNAPIYRKAKYSKFELFIKNAIIKNSNFDYDDPLVGIGKYSYFLYDQAYHFYMEKFINYSSTTRDLDNVLLPQNITHVEYLDKSIQFDLEIKSFLSFFKLETKSNKIINNILNGNSIDKIVGDKKNSHIIKSFINSEIQVFL